jgi:outer membrane protein insertion porin family
VDFGDVYPMVGDMLRSLQMGTGAGIRLNTPIGLFRLDFGVPVNRRPFDERWTVHFGLGHAF